MPTPPVSGTRLWLQDYWLPVASILAGAIAASLTVLAAPRSSWKLELVAYLVVGLIVVGATMNILQQVRQPRRSSYIRLKAELSDANQALSYLVKAVYRAKLKELLEMFPLGNQALVSLWSYRRGEFVLLARWSSSPKLREMTDVTASANRGLTGLLYKNRRIDEVFPEQTSTSYEPLLKKRLTLTNRQYQRLVIKPRVAAGVVIDSPDGYDVAGAIAIESKNPWPSGIEVDAVIEELKKAANYLGPIMLRVDAAHPDPRLLREVGL